MRIFRRPPPARPPRRTLVLGGVRSGKSTWAEAQLAAEPGVTYLATAPERPDDPEWQHRIAAHRARRPANWRTVQTTDLEAALRAATGPLLVDDLGNWLTAALDRTGGWADGAAGADGRRAVRDAADRLVAAWSATSTRVVLVTNEVGHGVVPPTFAGRLFRDELGTLNARLAAASDEVVLLVAGLPMWVRSAGAGRDRS